MARFYASITGNAKTAATRRGYATSGITGHIRGWDSGVAVIGQVNASGEDEFTVYATGGSHARRPDRIIATVDENGRIIHHGDV